MVIYDIKTIIFSITRDFAMLRYSLIFFIIALIAAVFGFGGIAAGAVEIAKILFFIFIVMAIIMLLINTVKRK